VIAPITFEEGHNVEYVEVVLSAIPVDMKSNDFHDFMYYMGEKMLNTRINESDFELIRSYTTRKLIIYNIINYINAHDDKDSVWGAVNQKTEDEVKVCTDKLMGNFRTLAFDAINFQGISIHSFAENSKIYPFENRVLGKSKVYKIGGEYIKGVCSGVKIDRPEAADICYNLENKSNKTVGTIYGLYNDTNVCGGLNYIWIQVQPWFSETDKIAKIRITSDILNAKYGKCKFGYDMDTLVVTKSLPSPGTYHVYITSGFVDDGWNGGYAHNTS
jgi:hypothetical protein